MSEKVRTYTKESVEVCRNCHGSGLDPEHSGGAVKVDRRRLPIPGEKVEGLCQICSGRGLIRKTSVITITIMTLL